MKINLAVAELPRVRGVDGDGDGVQPYHRGLIQISKPLADLDVDQASAQAGIPAEAAHMELCVPTVHDPSLAPEGTHVVTIGVRSQPYTLRDAAWDDIKEDVADRVVAHLGTFVPNLPGSILHREVLTPLDLERRLSLTGGHHLHGDMSPDQLLFLRPVRGYADYRTPVDRLYLCGAGTHPGGGVTGANGRNCAREVLHDVKREGLMLDRFDELADGLNHPEGVAWNPFDGLIYAGGEGGELYAVTLDGEVELRGTTGGSMLGIAVDGAGRVYACDAGRGEITRMDPMTGVEERVRAGRRRRRPGHAERRRVRPRRRALRDVLGRGRSPRDRADRAGRRDANGGRPRCRAIRTAAW